MTDGRAKLEHKCVFNLWLESVKNCYEASVYQGRSSKDDHVSLSAINEVRHLEAMWDTGKSIRVGGIHRKAATADAHSSRTQGYRMIQKYRILGKKGEGSFAEVVACQNVWDGKLYACKLLKRHFTSVEQALSLTEVRALRRLSPHINVVGLHDIIYDKKAGRLALVFELMDLNMHELLKARKKPLPEFRVKNYVYQLLKSLDHIHRHGIFHRDVKPENLLIRDNLLKLADFGSCRGMYTKRPYTEYISTRWYRPPECLLTSGHYSFKMDMWAAGCVFFEALTNLPLFPGSSEIDQIAKIHNVLGTPKSAVLKKLRRHKKRNRADFTFQMTPGIGIAALSPKASPEAHHLLSCLCAYDEEDRISAQQSLRHPYFQDLRLAEMYQTGRLSSSKRSKRTASTSKPSPSPGSQKSSLSRSEASPEPHERKKHRSDQLTLVPVVDASDQSSEVSIKAKATPSISLPPIVSRSARKKDHRHVSHLGHVSKLPPIQRPWRP